MGWGWVWGSLQELRQGEQPQAAVDMWKLSGFFTFLVFYIHSNSFGGYRKQGPRSICHFSFHWACTCLVVSYALQLCYFSGLLFSFHLHWIYLFLPQNNLGALRVPFSSRYPPRVTTLRCIIMQFNKLSAWSFLVFPTCHKHITCYEVTLNFEIYPPSISTNPHSLQNYFRIYSISKKAKNLIFFHYSTYLLCFQKPVRYCNVSAQVHRG